VPALSAANLFVAIRPWLLPFGRWSGIVFGIYVLALAGPIVLDPFNIDFIRFGPTELTVAMFCALFIAVGIALVPATNFTLTRLARGRVVLVALGFGLAGFDALLLAGIEIGARFEISAPSISRHLAILKAAELVSERRDGNRILYRLEPETLIASLNSYLSAVCPTQVRQRRRIAARRP